MADLAGRRAYEQAWRQFAQGQTPEEFCSSWLLIQSHIIGGVSDGVVVLLKPGTSAFAPVAFYPESTRERTRLAKISERALKEGRGVVEPVEAAAGATQPVEPRYQLAYPVRLDGKVHGVVGVDIKWRQEPALQSAMRDLQWGSGWLEVLLRRHADPMEAERLRLKLALDVVASLLEQPRFDDSATAFTTELAARLGCDRVTLGILQGMRVRICAVSHSPQFERRANLMRAIESAMEESIDQVETVVYPPVQENRPVVARAHEALLHESGAGSAATFPLLHGGRVVGALTLERAAGYRFDVPTLDICEAVASVAGPIAELKRGNETNLVAHAGKSAKSLWEMLAGPGYAALKLGAAGMLAVAAFLAFATGAYRVSANSRVEGAVQRAITAPINGYVKEASLRAGDTVTQGAAHRALRRPRPQAGARQAPQPARPARAPVPRSHGQARARAGRDRHLADRAERGATRARRRAARAHRDGGAVRRADRERRPVAEPGLAGGARAGAVRDRPARGLPRRAAGRRARYFAS